MKNVVFALALIASMLLSAAPAFSHGGAGCEACHTMHNSIDGLPVVLDPTIHLLKAANISSTCLNCHEGSTGPFDYRISTSDISLAKPPQQMTPAGDFGWLKIDYAVNINGFAGMNSGERRGHSIVATDRGFQKDSVLAVAPGGTFPSENLACNSCHDPHGLYRRFADGSFAVSGLPSAGSGSYENSPDPVEGVTAVTAYRMLAGVGFHAGLKGGDYSFIYDPPHAVAPFDYNRSEAGTQTRVAYGMGMSEWCANCHGAMLQNGFASGAEGQMHPAGNGALMTAAVKDSYNAYLTTGNLTGEMATSYSSLVPFEEGTSDYSALKAHARNDDSYLEGPGSGANVMCLSCHRAHASGFQSGLRYSTNTFFTIAVAGVASYDPSVTDNRNNLGLSPAHQEAALYGRPATVFGPYARSYCNKCHAKD